MTNNVIEINDVSFGYERDLVLEDINLTVPEGSFLGLVGPNGSGKSTLLKILLGILKPQHGDVKIFGEKISKFSQWERIGFVSQKANSFNSGFPATVFEVVSSGLTKKIGLFKFLRKTDRNVIIKALESVGMQDYLNRNIGELSGGQQQRVFIARAIVSSPDILILDEPTVGVDAKNVQSFYEMLDRLNSDLGITLVLVTHDIGTISSKVTHVACLNKHLHFHGDADEFERRSRSDLSQFYGHDVQMLEHQHSH
ncbi:metal ABC transporter ATP-binding protein [Falsibacillus pallidus]|uniref:Zinc transport system ATP-binding protein n=1 Tax=Falsibacillus pallidus TaxID=493781 RepID=A0A370GKU3_9BACI|nr:metal ABC transporter ATP-binding protein [Falsibacillus pallidus]RDI43980.1 zinc transport system ATP-binding protein [Falsibacillus pallidus]